MKIKNLSPEEQISILEQFFKECLQYWEKTLNIDSDLDNSAYKRAIADIPDCVPYYIKAIPFDEEIVKKFIKSRMMDCFGKNWEQYYNLVKNYGKDWKKLYREKISY